jgi:hypothetical protein
MDSKKPKFSKPFKKEVAAEPKSVAASEPKKEKAVTNTPSGPLPWKSIEHLDNALNRAISDEKTLKDYARILGIEYNSDYDVFSKNAKLQLMTSLPRYKS